MAILSFYLIQNVMDKKIGKQQIIWIFSGVRVTRSLVLSVCFVDRCLSFFFCPLCCLSYFDMRILITPLVSSNSSCTLMLLLCQSQNYSLQQPKLMVKLLKQINECLM